MKIYHNPRCRKSRETLKIIQENTDSLKLEKLQIIEYLKTPPTKTEIKKIISTLNVSAKDLVRKNESIFKNFKITTDLRENEYIDMLAKHPILIERPIVIKDNKGVIGRPPINVLDLLK